jgi:hypothetical protein
LGGEILQDGRASGVADQFLPPRAAYRLSPHHRTLSRTTYA